MEKKRINILKKSGENPQIFILLMNSDTELQSSNYPKNNYKIACCYLV